MKNPPHIPPRGFSVIQYFVSPIFDLESRQTVYEKFKTETNGRIISKEEANRLIKQYSLRLVVEEAYGRVWE